MEAFYLYFNKFQGLHQLIQERDEHWETFLSEEDSYKSIESPVRNIFWGHHFPLKNEYLEIGPIKEPTKNIKVSVKAATYKTIEEDESVTRIRDFVDIDEISKNVPDFEIGLEIKSGKKTIDFIELESFDNFFRRRMRRMPTRFGGLNNISSQVQKVSSNNFSSNNLIKLWDKVALTPLEEEVIYCLQLIEPHIRNLAFVGNIDYSERFPLLPERIPVVSLDNFEERLSLKSFGDGMSRLFNIILCLVNAKNGVLLIDEVENGLHWSVQPKLWEIIFKLSKELNIQVFATTHSRDCVKGFHDIWTKNNQNGCFYRLNKTKDDLIRAVQYNQDMLSDTLETEVEFR
jgi:AAA15 family ATPase/GTPase